MSKHWDGFLSYCKCVSVTTLTQKAHQGKGLSLEELQHRVNNECVIHRIEPKFGLSPRTAPTPNNSMPEDPKWRICQNFTQVNKVTKVTPTLQGNIRAKQQQLSGHRWVSGFDFVAGFYTMPVHPESQPYTAFYGKGYFWYKHMPFGLTGSPLTFANMMAKHMPDLLQDKTMKSFVIILLSPTHSKQIQAEWSKFGRNRFLVNTQPNFTSTWNTLTKFWPQSDYSTQICLDPSPSRFQPHSYQIPLKMAKIPSHS